LIGVTGRSCNLLAELWEAPGAEADFRKFQDLILGIVQDHGGQILGVDRPSKTDAPDGPDEIHRVQFPDADALIAYRADPRHVQLSGLRDMSVAKMVMTNLGTVHDD